MSDGPWNEIATLREQLMGRMEQLEARVYDLEHSHHYIIQELRVLIKATAEPAAAPSAAPGVEER